MPYLINSILVKLYFALEHLKGGKKLMPLPSNEEDILLVKAKYFFDYTLEIKVKRLVYVCSYENTFFKSKRFTTFEVSSKVDELTPDAIRKAFSKTYIFPRMLPEFIPLNKHMERAVNAYLDMIINDSVKDKEV